MTKQEMLDKLGTNQAEWDSYTAKSSKFVNEVLNGSERELHKRIFSNISLAILPTEAGNPQEIGDLYEAQKTLAAAVITENNIHRMFPILGKVDEQS